MKYLNFVLNMRGPKRTIGTQQDGYLFIIKIKIHGFTDTSEHDYAGINLLTSVD